MPAMILSLVLVFISGQDCQDLQSLARTAYDERRYDQAATQFARAVTACGSSAPLLLALGQAQLLARRPADALATLERIPDKDPDYLQALKVKAKAQYLLRRDADAEATLKRAAARAPSDAEVPYDLGRIYYQVGRHAEAAESFRRATALDPRAYVPGTISASPPRPSGTSRRRSGTTSRPSRSSTRTTRTTTSSTRTSPTC